MGNVKLTILGSGTSHGVPMIGCDCDVCTSSDPRDRRLRTSAVFTVGEVNLLVDTGPELRLQVIAARVARVDAILFTHAHSDHVFGLDDVRRFNRIQGCRIPAYGDVATISRLRECFGYVEVPWEATKSHRPSVAFHTIAAADGPFYAAGVSVTPIELMHGELPILGFRVGDVAYCTDCNAIPPASMDRLRGLDTLVLDGLRWRKHETHFTIEQACDVIADLQPRRAFLTHLTHDVSHARDAPKLPAGVEFAFDGLIIE